MLRLENDTRCALYEPHIKERIHDSTTRHTETRSGSRRESEKGKSRGESTGMRVGDIVVYLFRRYVAYRPVDRSYLNSNQKNPNRRTYLDRKRT